MSQLLLTRTNFLFTFFGKSFRQFYNTLFAAFSFNLFALNLEFELNTQRELFLTESEYTLNGRFSLILTILLFVSLK